MGQQARRMQRPLSLNGGTWRNATVAKTASVKGFDDGPSRRFGLHRGRGPKAFTEADFG
jgi:hypothetical protein